MKSFTYFAAGLAVGAAALAAPAAARETPVCLKTYWIDSTRVVDPRTILFRMKDGKVYRSNLSTPCIGLRFNGFVYETSYEEVCGGSQLIRVLKTGEVCRLGNFELQQRTRT